MKKSTPTWLVKAQAEAAAQAAKTSCAICLPQETGDISRRQLLASGVSMTAYLSVAKLLAGAGTARAADSTNYPPQRKLVWINMSGGWDILEVTDPKPNSTGKLQLLYDYGQSHPVAGATDGSRLGRWLPNLAGIGADLLVVRGIAMGTTSHPAGSAYMDKGVLSNTGIVNSASIPAIIASESQATIPIVQLAGGSDPQTDRGILKPVSVVRAQNLDLYRSMYPADDAAIQRRMAILDLLKTSVAKSQGAVGANSRLSDLSAAEAKLRVQFAGNVGAKMALTDADKAAFTTNAPKGMSSDSQNAVALALKLLNNDLVTCINLGFGGFDTHQNQNTRLAPILASVDFLLAQFVAGLKASGQLDKTLIILYSDFGRTPAVNGASGRDHWPVGGALVMGGGIAGGRTVGATSDDTLSAAELIDPTTGLKSTDGATGVQLNPTHIGGLALALTLGPAYATYRPYLPALAALTRLKGS